MSSQKSFFRRDRECVELLVFVREVALRSESQAHLAVALRSKSAELLNLAAQFCTVHEHNKNAIKTLQGQYEHIPYLKEIYSWRLIKPLRKIARKLLRSWNEEKLKKSIFCLYAAELTAFLISGKRLVLRTAVSPYVTVILV